MRNFDSFQAPDPTPHHSHVCCEWMIYQTQGFTGFLMQKLLTGDFR